MLVNRKLLGRFDEDLPKSAESMRLIIRSEITRNRAICEAERRSLDSVNKRKLNSRLQVSKTLILYFPNLNASFCLIETTYSPLRLTGRITNVSNISGENKTEMGSLKFTPLFRSHGKRTVGLLSKPVYTYKPTSSQIHRKSLNQLVTAKFLEMLKQHLKGRNLIFASPKRNEEVK